MWKSLVIASLVVLSACATKGGLQQTTGKAKEKCLDSVREFMTGEEAEAFCSQSPKCRKWWDDMSEEEQRELQPPFWKHNPDGWMKCENPTPYME
jgi:hypothetical protein